MIVKKRTECKKRDWAMATESKDEGKERVRRRMITIWRMEGLARLKLRDDAVSGVEESWIS